MAGRTEQNRWRSAGGANRPGSTPAVRPARIPTRSKMKSEIPAFIDGRLLQCTQTERAFGHLPGKPRYRCNGARSWPDDPAPLEAGTARHLPSRVCGHRTAGARHRAGPCRAQGRASDRHLPCSGEAFQCDGDVHARLSDGKTSQQQPGNGDAGGARRKQEILCKMARPVRGVRRRGCPIECARFRNAGCRRSANRHDAELACVEVVPAIVECSQHGLPFVETRQFIDASCFPPDVCFLRLRYR